MVHPKNKMEIRINSDKVNLDKVEGFIHDMFKKHEIGMELYNRVLVCVNEAVVNSIEHGNKNDLTKSVIIQCFLCHSYLYFRIIDQGEGFDYNEIPDPTEAENLCKESGRGIYIIRNISDSIGFREKGNIVEFKIKSGGKD